MTSARLALTLLVAFASAASAFSQVKEPPRAQKLDVQIRYRIRAERDERVVQYRALEKYLASLGFEDGRKDDPNRDLDILDPNAERFVGTIPSARVLEILNDPRVQNILFAPSGYAYPEAGDTPIPIRIVLRTGLIPTVQQSLHSQSLAQLELLGFKDALGYDTRAYSQIKGSIPYKNLNLLVKDLRSEPSGWFLPNTPPDRLPRPLADRNPIRWVEVMPFVGQPAAFSPELVLPARARFAPDLRAKLVDPAAKETPLVVEVMYAMPMEDRLDSLRTMLAGNYGRNLKRNADGTPIKGADGVSVLTEGASVEGATGNVLSIRFDRPADVERFALEPGILSMRLPRAGIETILPLGDERKPMPTQSLLKSSGIDSLQRLGYAGKGVKVVVVGTDFTDAEKQIGTSLPKKTQIVDLTAELNAEILPLPADGSRAAANIAVARAVALAAPEAEIVLVRVDPSAFFQLPSIIRFARGESGYSTAMRSRLFELSYRSSQMLKAKEAALLEYRQAFEDLADDEPTRLRRMRARATLNNVGAQQADLALRLSRFNALQKQMTASLFGARVIVNQLVWESGYPLDALSELSRTLDRLAAPTPTRVARPATGINATAKPSLVWVQAASPSGAAIWGGPFLDANRNGTMEFAAAGAALPAGSWTPEMNFIAMKANSGEVSPDLPAGVRVRFAIQWREPLDPRTPNLDIPAYPVVLRVFRQLDPTGEKQPSDEMAEAARSAGGPYPIVRTTTYVVYEQLLEFAVPEAGRYAFVVATGYQPDPLLPALRRAVEISPRVHLETLSAKPGEPQAVFQSYTTPKAGVGIPGDSQGAVTVGVPEPGAATGGGTGLGLLVKPDLLGPDGLDLGGLSVRGSGVASGFAAGIAADLVQADVAGSNVFRSVGVQPGKQPVIPDSWSRYLRPIPRTTDR